MVSCFEHGFITSELITQLLLLTSSMLVDRFGLARVYPENKPPISST